MNIHRLRESGLSNKEIYSLISKLPPKDQKSLLSDFSFWARENQIMPEDWHGIGYMMLMGRGAGKALGKSTTIINTLNNGFIEFGLLKVGDVIFDEMGLPTTVVDIYNQSEKQIKSVGVYRVSFNTGESVICCGEHLWVTNGKVRTTKQLIFSSRYERHTVPVVNSSSHREIVSIDRVSDSYDPLGYMCITVDSPSRMFCVGKDMIPTHNTYTGSNWVIQRAKSGYSPIAIVGQTVADVRDVMVEGGPSSIINQAPSNFKPKYEPSKRRLTFPNGAIALTYSGDSPEQLRGANNASVWLDELCKFSDPEESWTQLILGLRVSDNPKVLVTTTPKPIPIIKRLYEDQAIFKITGSTFDNVDNLSANFISELKKKYEGTRLGRQEINGEILWESEDAVFSQDDIDKYRVKEAPFGDNITYAIGVDPAVTTNKGSDSTGIVVGCVNNDTGHGYVVSKHTGKYTPSQWARKVSDLCESYNTKLVIPEVNQGGDLVKETIYQNDNSLIVIPVRATKGKLLRAEPLGLLCEQGRLHIVGSIPELEEQMVSYEGVGKSPDSYDAMVWVMTYLMLGRKRKVTVSEFYL